MHILSTIKQHVTSVATCTPSSANGSYRAVTSDSEVNHHHHRSIRSVFGGKSKPKYRRQPCPPISIQTKEISWPMGSGDRDSTQLEDYDVLSTSDIRSVAPRSCGPIAQNNVSSATDGDVYNNVSSATDGDVYVPLPTSARRGSAGDTFPLSRRRAMSISRRPYPCIAKDISENPTADLMATATDTMRPTVSISTSISSTSTAISMQIAHSAPIAHRSSGIYSPPLSPDTPTSAFSYVDIRLPRSPLSASTSHEGRIRCAGALSGARPYTSAQYSDNPRHRGNRNASPVRHRVDLLYQSLTSLDLSQSTTSTVVSAALSGANRPTSSRSGGSANSGTLNIEQKKHTEDDDALRGPPPRDDWDIVLDRIKEYRASHEAPVDTVGCEAISEEEKDPKLRRFRSLISLMLSAQTKDEITAEAVRTLSQRLPGGLTPKALSEAPLDLIHECVRRVGFWQRKSNYIKEAARTCLEQYDGDIPRTVPQLLSLPGVGPKMAYIAMHAAWQDTQGIGVDTHVLRITHRLGWVEESAKSPEATRHALESWMPRSLWREINPLLVGLGQTVCRGVGPKCGECPVNRFCPSAQLRPKSSSSRRETAYSSMKQLAHDAVMSDSAEFGDVDVEDIASMVRGAEHAVRSRKHGVGRSRQGAVISTKTRFPEIPASPMSNAAMLNNMRTTRARAASRLRPRQASSPMVKSESSDLYDPRTEKDAVSDTECKPSIPPVPTPETSHYFVRSRSNAASEEVRPEAKTDSVCSARARATAEKLYSRRLSRSDMQWALGEDWDPDDNSSLSSLSDIDISAADDEGEDDVCNTDNDCSGTNDNARK
ncbi:alpha,alpha-trehalase nth1 [Coemansia sp. RSA 1365]|nr:alpha,alpha-trehalase nth1 [Coemansia sp. RSA 1365]